ncbi:MAG: hypothetical protein OXF77_00050 [Thaumarchaeota archaeon]|nr:hypothetical protein [Nitrososphaerota archaeon]
MDKVFEVLESIWQDLENQQQYQIISLGKQIQKLQSEIQTSLQKIKVLNNSSTIKYMEEDIVQSEKTNH